MASVPDTKPENIEFVKFDSSELIRSVENRRARGVCLPVFAARARATTHSLSNHGKSRPELTFLSFTTALVFYTCLKIFLSTPSISFYLLSFTSNRISATLPIHSDHVFVHKNKKNYSKTSINSFRKKKKSQIDKLNGHYKHI